MLIVEDKSLCLICNKEYNKYSDKHVFCSKHCCDLSYRKTKKGITKVNEHKIYCLACNKDLIVDNNITKYCNKKCKNDYKNRLRDEYNKSVKKNNTCVCCKKSFFPTFTYQKFCSKSCKQKEFIKNHLEEYRLKTQMWSESDRGREWLKKYESSPERKLLKKTYMANNPKLRFINKLRDRVNKAILLQGGKRSVSTKILLGADVAFVREYLEKQFDEYMSWDNHGLYGWHIDHILPCASFDLTKISEQKKCFHYTNLQPLWCFENISKGKKIIGDK